MIIKLLRGLVILCVFSVQSMYAQGTVSGTITDASDSMTLTGVNVTEKELQMVQLPILMVLTQSLP